MARILFFKIKPSQDILKIRDDAPLEAEEILIYKKPSKWIGLLDVPSNVVQKKIVTWILFFKIMSSQEILKIRDGTPLEAKEILTHINKLSKRIDMSLVIRVTRILIFKIRSSQEILKIRDGTPLEAEDILTYIKNLKMDQFEILKIRDCTPLEAEDNLTYIKKSQNGSIWYFSSKLDVPSNVVQKKRVVRILIFKIRPSQDILKIRDGTPLEKILKIQDGTPLEAKEILTHINKLSKRIDMSIVIRVTRILIFKIRSSQEILKIRDATPLEAEDILTYIKNLKTDQFEILKIRDCTSLEAKDNLTYIKKSQNGSIWYFYSKLDVPSNVVQKKRVVRILIFKIRTSQEILKIRDGTPLEAEEILIYKKTLKMDRSSQEILKIRDGNPLEAKDILTYIKKSQNGSIWYFSNKLDVPSNVVQKKRVVRILIFKIRPSQEILKIRDCTPLEAKDNLTYIKKSQNGSIWYFSSKLDVPSNVVQKKRVVRILIFKIRPSQKFLKIRDGTPLELDVPSNVVQKKRVAWILFFKIRLSQEILKIRDGTPLEAEEILTYIKNPRNGSIWYFSSKLDVPSNVVRVARILIFKIRSSQEILKIRDGTPLEAEDILTYIKKSQNGPICYFSNKLDVPSNVVQKKRVVRILIFKIRLSQEILKIRDGTPLEAEEILIYKKTLKMDRFGTFLAS
ncbi:hypothetical protein OROHE_026803 [Orobanche hederae]